MKFQVRVGKEFKLDVDTTKKEPTFLEKVYAGIAIFISVGFFSAAAYGAVSGDYLIFESITDILHKIIDMV